MANELSPIEAHECTLGVIFSNSYAFEIPPYQRPYAWEIEQARDLLADIVDAMNNTSSSGEVYFLGSIVLIKSPNDTQSKVVDGQQRLTTLTILLSVLRDLTTDPEMRLNRGSYVFQKANPDSGAQDRFRVLLRFVDRAFFQKTIQNPGATNSLPDPETLEGSHKRIAENAVHLRKEIEKLDEKTRNDLMKFIVQRCYLVVVAVPTPEAARRIFRVLNTRGLDLTATDILKSSLLDRVGTTGEVDLARRWEQAENALGRDLFVELFGHIRMIYERDKPRTALETGFEKAVAPFSQSAEEFMANILEPIVDASILLSDNGAIRKQFGAEAAKAVRSLERIDNKDWVPPALLRLWKRTPGEDQKVAQFLIDLERAAYYLFVTRQDINARIARYVGVMDEFEPRTGKAAPNVGLALSDKEQCEFIEALSGDLYPKSRVCKPALERLDEALSTGGAVYDQVVSIEHVLPQTVEEGSEWAKLFADVKAREKWTHRLANLVLLTRRINTKASNWDFDTKKKKYFASEDGSSPFPLTQGVLQTQIWTPEHLDERQGKLIEVLRKLWRLDAVNGNQNSGP